MSASVSPRWAATFILDGHPAISFPFHSYEICLENSCSWGTYFSPSLRESTGNMKIVLRRAELAGLPNLEVSARGQLNIWQGDLALRYPIVFRNVGICRSSESETMQYDISFAIVPEPVSPLTLASAFAPEVVVDSISYSDTLLENLQAEYSRRIQELLDRQYADFNPIPTVNYNPIQPVEEEAPSLPVIPARRIPKRRRNIRVPLAASLSE